MCRHCHNIYYIKDKYFMPLFTPIYSLDNRCLYHAVDSLKLLYNNK